MHRAIAAWLIERPWRAVIATAIGGLLWQVLLPFSLVFAGAVPVLMALRVDAKFALSLSALGAAVAWTVFAPVQPAVWSVAGVALLFFSPALLALLLRRTGSLNLCFQIAVVGAGIALVIVHMLLSDPVAVWTDLLRAVLQSMIDAGLRIEGDHSALLSVWARTMWGALTALVLATVLGSLLLGRWWLSLLESPGSFGAEYRRLRLGTVLGIVTTALFIAAVFADAPLIASLAWVAFAALSFQGLAAAHRSKARGWLNRGWLTAIYVLLIVPLSMSVTVFVLAIWGFVDNWLRPKTQAVGS